jgi:hypothetical protein
MTVLSELVAKQGKQKAWKVVYSYLVFLYASVMVDKKDEEFLFGELVEQLSLARSFMHTNKQGVNVPMYQPSHLPFNALDALHQGLKDSLQMVRGLKGGNEGVSVLNMLNCPQKSNFLQSRSFTLRYFAALSALLGGVRFFIVDLRRYCLPAKKATADDDDVDESAAASSGGGGFCEAVCSQTPVCQPSCTSGSAGPAPATDGVKVSDAEHAMAALMALQQYKPDDWEGWENSLFFEGAVANEANANAHLALFEAAVIIRDLQQRKLPFHEHHLVIASGRDPKLLIRPPNLEAAPRSRVAAAGVTPDEFRFQRLTAFEFFGRVSIGAAAAAPVPLAHTCHPSAIASQQDLELLVRSVHTRACQLRQVLRLSTAPLTKDLCRRVLHALFFPLMLANLATPAVPDPSQEVQRLWSLGDDNRRFAGGSAHAASSATASASKAHFVLAEDGGDSSAIALSEAVFRRAIDFQLWSEPSRLDALRRAAERTQRGRMFGGLDLAHVDFSLDAKNDQHADLIVRRARRGDVGVRRILDRFLFSRGVVDRAVALDPQVDARLLRGSHISRRLLFLFGADFLE